MITSRHILTAAHCHKPPGLNFVRLGEHNVRTTSDGMHNDIPIKLIKIHEKYNGNKRPHDIAIVYLAHDVDFSGNLMIKIRKKQFFFHLNFIIIVPYSDRIRPICLPIDKSLQNRKFIGTNPIVAGNFKYQLQIEIESIKVLIIFFLFAICVRVGFNVI